MHAFKNSQLFTMHMEEKNDNAKANDETVKQKYAELRMAAAQIKQLQQQIEAAEEKTQELENAHASLDGLKNAARGAGMLAPIADGIFVKAELGSNSELIVNVGSNVCVKKTAEQAKEMLKGKLQEIIGYQEATLEDLNRLTEDADKLETELGKMLQEE